MSAASAVTAYCVYFCNQTTNSTPSLGIYTDEQLGQLMKQLHHSHASQGHCLIVATETGNTFDQAKQTLVGRLTAQLQGKDA